MTRAKTTPIPKYNFGIPRERPTISDAAGGTDWFILDHLPSITTSHDRPNHLLANGSDGAMLE